MNEVFCPTLESVKSTFEVFKPKHITVEDNKKRMRVSWLLVRDSDQLLVSIHYIDLSKHLGSRSTDRFSSDITDLINWQTSKTEVESESVLWAL